MTTILWHDGVCIEIFHMTVASRSDCMNLRGSLLKEQQKGIPRRLRLTKKRNGPLVVHVLQTQPSRTWRIIHNASRTACGIQLFEDFRPLSILWVLYLSFKAYICLLRGIINALMSRSMVPLIRLKGEAAIKGDLWRHSLLTLPVH